MFSEEELLQLLKVQSNISPKDFRELFGEDRSERLFPLFAEQGWNVVSFMFNCVNGDDRKKLLEFVNDKIEQLN